MPSAIEIVEAIHATPCRIVLAVSGGGSGALASLLIAPGASRTIFEALVPYSENAMVDFLGGRPDQFCSPQAARAMAMAAFQRACRYGGTADAVAGLSCSASLATDREKLGAHRAHVALQSADTTVTWSVELEKGWRTRAEEEELVCRLVLNAVAEACGLEARLDPGLRETEHVERSAVVAPRPWRDLLLGLTERVHQGGRAGSADTEVRAVFPGAFNPLHAGHRGMARIAEEILSTPVEFEISILNVDKPPLDYHEIELRTRQFLAEESVWLTRSPTFEEKSRLFPGATFVVGSDTLARIADPRYYNNDADACRLALERIAARDCRFLVFGRNMNGRYVHLANLDLPEPLRPICEEVPEERFRADISSTEVRRTQGA
ncbi:MAG: hypothetical protein HUU20_13045 [Pirellulales bacterium]|nr:hypothetical protein [Pirellulales bacterium]